MHWIRGDGGLCGSAVDLARWARLLHTGRVVSSASYAAMIAPTPVSSSGAADHGFGLSLIEPDARRKIAHGGAMLGYSAMAAWYPDDELTVVVLTNRGDAGPDAIERRLARRVLRLPESVRAPSRCPSPSARAFAARTTSASSTSSLPIAMATSGSSHRVMGPP